MTTHFKCIPQCRIQESIFEAFYIQINSYFHAKCLIFKQYFFYKILWGNPMEFSNFTFYMHVNELFFFIKIKTNYLV